MKVLIVLLAVVACSLSASVPSPSAVPFAESLPISSGNAAQDNANSRIARGHEAKPNQFPFMVGIKIVHSDRISRCGGSLISTGWVLTAAHCTIRTNSQYIMRFGSINLVDGGIALATTQIINHANYNRNTLNNDVSLLRIPSPLTISDAIRPIRLPTAGQIGSTFVNHHGTVSGFGESIPFIGVDRNVLRWVTLRVISNEQCIGSYPGGFVIGSVICADGSLDMREGICGGDSGGPLAIDEDGVPTLLGVASFAAGPALGGCGSRHPAGFTRTTHFLQWIFEHTGLAIRYR